MRCPNAHQTLHELVRRFGLHGNGREFRGDCPACGYGNDAFKLSERDGRILYWCANCQDQAALSAVMGGAGALPPPSPSAAPVRASDAERLAERIARARRLWDGAEPITPDCAAHRYLAHRRIPHVANSGALRWRPDTPHPGAGGRRLALLARIDDPAGAFCGVQRIYLTPAGRKADIEPVKATLGIVAGGAVRLDPPGVEVVIGEGMETSASAGLLLGLPAWAAISAGNLGRSMALPSEVQSVVVATDHDPEGIKAARAAARRWRAEGLRVRFALADAPGADLADVLAARTAP